MNDGNTGEPKADEEAPAGDKAGERVAPELARNPGAKPLAGQWFDYPNPELVIGLVAAVGTDLEAFIDKLEGVLRQYRYKPNTVHLSDLLHRVDADALGIELKEAPEFQRLQTHMQGGTKLRGETYPYVFALHAAAALSEQRDLDEIGKVRRVHILRSLKHPDEVYALRKIYGVGFYLIGIHTEEDERQRHLEREMSPDEARLAIQTDEEERIGGRVRVKHGQQTRDTFELADVFVTANGADEQLMRLFDLIFGDPFRTPTPDEHGMFLAYASSVRSGSLSRQVGAAVMAPSGEIFATGANDVPRFGGGQYWPGEDDERDFRREYDPNDFEKEQLLLRIMAAAGYDNPDEKTRDEWKEKLKPTGLFDLTEYGRDVHAEMDALLTCARLGISVRGATLYCTTFPCHNCAKHIVAAGVRRVVYVEPYPKSRALDLHSDAITTDPALRAMRVVFEPFVGVGPRRYFDLFSIMGISTGFRVDRKKDGRRVQWSRGDANARIPMRPNSYVEREDLATKDLGRVLEWLDTKGGKRVD